MIMRKAQRARRPGRRDRLRRRRRRGSSTPPSERRPLALTALAVHGVMTGVAGPGARRPAQLLRRGHPRRAAGALGAELAARRRPGRSGLRPDAHPAGAARGPPTRACRSTSTAPPTTTLDRLIPSCTEMFPALKIAGREASKFRAVAAGRGRARSPHGSSARARGSYWSGWAARARRSSRTRCARCCRCRCSRSARPSTTTPASCASRPPWMQRVRAGVAVAAGPGAGPAVAALPAAQPGLPGPARRPRRPASGRPRPGAGHRAADHLRGLTRRLRPAGRLRGWPDPRRRPSRPRGFSGVAPRMGVSDAASRARVASSQSAPARPAAYASAPR